MTNKPFGRALITLLRSRDEHTHPTTKNVNLLSFAQCNLEPEISYETLRKAVIGDRPVSEKIVTATARALELEPEYFVEGRLAKLRRELDENVVGFDSALARLQRIEDADAA